MDELREIDIKRFPLTKINDVVGLFEDQLKSDQEPNLTLLSIVLGTVEHLLTIKKPLEKRQRGRPNELLALRNVNQIDGQETKNGINDDENIPTIELADVNVLFELFVKLIKDNVDLSLFEHSKYTSTGLLKKVSDVLWTTLSRTFYKDKGHLQFLNTLFSEQKMDCFGMAFGVIAGCQILGLKDVHMAVTEDHVWAVHGKNECLTSEITWHGKGTEDRRGHPVSKTAPEKSWLYEHPMICNRQEEVAILVVAINTIIHATMESYQMAAIQKRILWIMHDLGHLKRYPIALSTLADLEEIQPSFFNNNNNNNNNNNKIDNNDSKLCNNNNNNNNNNIVNTSVLTNDNHDISNSIQPPLIETSHTRTKTDITANTIASHTQNSNNTTNTPTTSCTNIQNTNNTTDTKKDHKRPSSLQLYKQAINISMTYYDDSKIYPHTYLGNYFYRRRRYKDAIRSWADAAAVASCFNYNREDDELYREFHEIANDIMPNIIRTCCAVVENNSNNNSNAAPSVPSRYHQKKSKKKLKPNQKSGSSSDKNNGGDIINADVSNNTSGVDTTDTANKNNAGGITENVDGTTDHCNDNKDSIGTTIPSTNQQKQQLSGNSNNISATKTNSPNKFSSKSLPSLLLYDSDCYADVLRFFDGICKWEEGSTMPVLHIIWANNMAFIVSKFVPEARTNVEIRSAEEVEDASKNGNNLALDHINNSNGVDVWGNKRQQNDATAQQKVRKRTQLLLESQKMASMKDLLTNEKLNTSAIKLLLPAQSQINSKSSSSLHSNNSTNSRQSNSDVGLPPRKRTRFSDH